MHLDTDDLRNIDDDLRNIEDELYYKYELLKFAIKNKQYGDIVEVSQDITKLAYILNIKDKIDMYL